VLRPCRGEIAMDLWSAHYGGVFSGAHAVLSALVPLAAARPASPSSTFSTFSTFGTV